MQRVFHQIFRSDAWPILLRRALGSVFAGTAYRSCWTIVSSIRATRSDSALFSSDLEFCPAFAEVSVERGDSEAASVSVTSSYAPEISVLAECG